MLDQSYSYENFRIILDVENRKGKYLEDSNFFTSSDLFEKSRNITAKIIEINKSIREEYSKLPPKHLRTTDDYEKIELLEENKNKLKDAREVALEEILREISYRVNSDDFKLHIKKGIVKFDDQLYVSEDKPENYFVQKQLQRNIHKTFNVKQGDRKKIISQIKLLLSDKFPKLIIRTDISNFYESVPHEQLIEMIEDNRILSSSSKSYIKDILNQYWQILLLDGIKHENEERIGLPRGIGLSALLSELFLRDFDKRIKNLPNVSYYARYVDDIVVIITPNHRNENLSSSQYESLIKKNLNKFKLQMNKSKTKIIDLRKSNLQRKTSKSYSLEFLGYQFVIRYVRKKREGGKTFKIIQLPLRVCMSEKKNKKYHDKIKLAFDEFHNNIVKYAGKESKTNNILVQRIKILTSNFRLFRRKDNILIGVYFSNEFLTNDLSDITDLDVYLKSEIDRVSPRLAASAKSKLDKMSFKKGFMNKSTLNFNFNNGNKRGVVNIEKIINIWSKL